MSRETRQLRRAARRLARRTFIEEIRKGTSPEAAADIAEEAVREAYGNEWVTIAALIIEFIMRLLEAFSDE